MLGSSASRASAGVRSTLKAPRWRSITSFCEHLGLPGPPSPTLRRPATLPPALTDERLAVPVSRTQRPRTDPVDSGGHFVHWLVAAHFSVTAFRAAGTVLLAGTLLLVDESGPALAARVAVSGLSCHGHVLPRISRRRPIVRAPTPKMACRSMAICHIFW